MTASTPQHMARELRLLVVSNFYPPRIVGGAEVVAHRHARLMGARGWRVTVLAGVLPSPEFPTGAVHVEQVEGIEVVLVGLRSLDPDDNFQWSVARNLLVSLIATTRPDWVHAHNLMGLGVDLIHRSRAGRRQNGCQRLHDNWGYCFKSTRLRNNGAVCDDVEECHLCLNTIRSSNGPLPIRMRRDFVMRCLDHAGSPYQSEPRSRRTLCRSRG